MNWSLIWQGFLETCMMTFWTSVISYALGMPLGVLLVITRKDGIRPAPTFNAVLGAVINFLRSIPFIGTTASVFPRVVSATPYIARVVEQSFLEVDGGVIEAAKAMGSSTWQIIWKVLIPESVPSLVTGAAMAVTTILAYTAMVSAVGGGGIGAYAITKGYQRGKKYYDFMYVASAVLVLMVQVIAITGTRLTRRLDHRIR